MLIILLRESFVEGGPGGIDERQAACIEVLRARRLGSICRVAFEAEASGGK